MLNTGSVQQTIVFFLETKLSGKRCSSYESGDTHLPGKEKRFNQESV